MTHSDFSWLDDSLVSSVSTIATHNRLISMAAYVYACKAIIFCRTFFPFFRTRPRWPPHVTQPNVVACSEIKQTSVENSRPKMWGLSPKLWGPKNCRFSTGFTITLRLKRECLRNEAAIAACTNGTTNGTYILNIWWTLAHKRLGSFVSPNLA